MENNTYKGVELFADEVKYNKHDNKINLAFHLNGTDYNNGTLVPIRASAEFKTKVFEVLIEWAHMIIDDHIKS